MKTFTGCYDVSGLKIFHGDLLCVDLDKAAKPGTREAEFHGKHYAPAEIVSGGVFKVYAPWIKGSFSWEADGLPSYGVKKVSRRKRKTSAKSRQIHR